MRYPPRRTVGVASRLSASPGQILQIPHQRQLAFAKVDRLRRIIIHLRVHVEVVIAAPAHSASFAIVPDALQMQGQRRILPRAGQS
ncbi:hypothetical protein D3C76_1381280 [compost metagenome]